MTVQEVKETLPDVKVKLPSGIILKAIPAGRKNPFATVYIPGLASLGFEVAWETLTACINNDKPIIL